MLKTEELRQLNLDELAEKAGDLKKEFFNLRLSAKTGKLEKNHRIREIKQDIARVLSIQNELRKGRPEAPSKPTVEEIKKRAAMKKAAVKSKEETKKEKGEPEKKEKPKRGLFGRRKKG